MKVTFDAVGRRRPFEKADFDIPDGSSLDDLIKTIDAQYGSDWICGMMTLNGKLVSQDDTTDIKMKDGDLVSLYPPISGG